MLCRALLFSFFLKKISFVAIESLATLMDDLQISA